MIILPVIVRELRVQARQRLTFTLRELGVLAMLLVGGLFAIGHPLAARSGGELFAYLHCTLFFAIWILVPFSAADCISRERREGTLGLLFLTPLKARDIVIAKGIAHGLRALTLLVAVLPVMTIPFLLGGLSWQQAVLSALINFSSVCWALAAALVASALNRIGLRAMVTAVALAVCALMMFALVLGLTVSGWGRYRQFVGMGVTDYTWLFGLGVAGASPGHWLELVASFSGPQLVQSVLQSAVCSMLALAMAVWLAAKRIKGNWREEPAPAWVQWSQRVFCTPVVWLSFFRWWMRRKLNRNPIGWLEQRTWSSRLVTWSWLAVVISLYSVALTDANFFRNYGAFQTLLAWLLVGSIAASAAGSFRRERENGVLELLLVAPLTTTQIIRGRLRGLWGQFLPSMALLLGVWLYFLGILRRHTETEGVFFFAVTFLTLPVIGLYFSVHCRNYISAFLLTVVCGLLTPAILQWVVSIIFAEDAPLPNPGRSMYGFSLGQLLLTLFFGTKLHRRLETRSFPLERTAF
jgi:ABC-type Na+ efflux pump permease subunit